MKEKLDRNKWNLKYPMNIFNAVAILLAGFASGAMILAVVLVAVLGVTVKYIDDTIKQCDTEKDL